MKAASLNHVYRLVWSKLQQAWVAVAEHCSAHGKSTVSGEIKAPVAHAAAAQQVNLASSAKLRYVMAIAFAASIASLNAFADTNVVSAVVAGDLTIKNLSDTHTQYLHTANVNIVDFYKFGVMKGHQLDVIMPDAGRALYRVIGNSRSEIMGNLNSNGTLFLINQNGVLFGQGSEVNVGNIVASSLNITNDDFLSGRYQFNAGNVLGNVENRGVIKAKNEGYIVLLGKTVDNSGTLVASNGSVVLGSAQTATLDFFGNGLVKAKLSGDALEANIKNSGAIYADGGFVQMATNARASAINISGIVEANQLVNRNGVIRLEGGDNAKVEVSGQLIAKGQGTTGGAIEVTGEQVALLNGALLDASGDTGGGKVLVGGDYQGKNGEVYNARTTYVAEGASIKADAVAQGDGGKVIVWADDLTRYYGDISAKGGAAKGNGGFVEVSGKQNLDFNGGVNVSAANGLGGTVLLDPETINLISSGGTTIPANNTNGTPDLAFADTPTTANINVGAVQGFSELYLQASKDINVNAQLNMSVGKSIRFEAGQDINVKQAITTSNADISLTATNNINIDTGATVTAKNGNVNLLANNDINQAAAVTASGKGSVNIEAKNQLNMAADIAGGSGVTIKAAAINRTAGNIIASGGLGASGHAGAVRIDVTGFANLAGANISAVGRIGSSSPKGYNGGDVTINAGSLTVGNIDASGSSAGVASSSGGNGGNVNITTTGGDANVGTIYTGAGKAGTGSNIAASQSGQVNIAAVGNINTGDISTKGHGDAGVSDVGNNSNGANVKLASAGGSVTAGNINTSATTAKTGTAGTNAGDIEITAKNAVVVGEINASGATGKGAGGNSGAVTLKSADSSVTFKKMTLQVGLSIGAGTMGQAKDVFVRAGTDVFQSGDILTNAKALNTTIVAGLGYKNTGSFDIATGADGRWLIYAKSPDNGTRGMKILDGYDFKQYGVSYDGVQNGTQQIDPAAQGNGLIYSDAAVVTPTLDTNQLDPNITKVYDGTTAADASSMALVREGYDGDVITFTNIVTANYDNKNVGTQKDVISNPVSIVSVSNFGRSVFGYTLSNGQSSMSAVAKGQITPASIQVVTGITANDKVFDGNTTATLNTGAASFSGMIAGDQLNVATANGAFNTPTVGNGKPVAVTGITLGGVDAGNYILVNNTATTTASILAATSPRDNAGLGGLVPNNPALNTMTIVSLNPAAGDEEDLDAVACPVNEDHLGSTPILSSGVKLPDGVNSNCI